MTHRDRYENFVVHPRFGNKPRITGLNPEPDLRQVFLHWHSQAGTRIPNTALTADLAKQAPATVPVTHYFDALRTCRDCNRPFIFFAEEQKHWYEELGFALEADCIRCPVCRKRQQGLARAKERYEELFRTDNRSDDQNLEMADCCLTLLENKVFHPGQTAQVRMLLNRISEQGRDSDRYRELTLRLQQCESTPPG